MNEDSIDNRRPENAELRRSIDKLIYDGYSFMEQNLNDLNIHNYRYNINNAVDELDLEEDLIIQLLEDYIIQILKSKVTFYELIKKLRKAELNNINLDYTELRDLAHKNLGVARNLRIDDSQKILTLLMKEEDLDYMRICVKALEVSAVKLNPLCAYETMKLIKVKNSL